MFETAELGLRVSKEQYAREEPPLRVALLQAQQELKSAGFPVILLVSGADGAGKGEIVNLLNEWMDPRFLITHAFGAHSEEERERPEYWRFWRALPPKGRIGLFFGSWYTRPIVQRAYGEIKGAALDAAAQRIAAFEKELVDDGALLLKFWFHLSKADQKKRLKSLSKDPDTAWRVTRLDWKHYRLYDRFRKVSERVVRHTSTGAAPWLIVEAKDRRYQALTVGRAILEQLQKRLAQNAAQSGAPAKDRTRAAAEARPAKPGPNILKKVDLTQKVTEEEGKAQIEHWEARLNALCRKAQARGVSSIAVFEGWDAAGKGGAIRRITAALDARSYRVIPIAAPTEEERAQHYLWRFWRHLPRAGRVTIFDRSWYGRVMVERVEGFAREAEWRRAYAEINDFEEQLAEHGMVVLKFFLHISPEEQLRRFKERERTPWKRFKITDEDYRNRSKWAAYEWAINELVERTSTECAPWTLVPSNDKRFARVHILKTFCERLKKAL